MTEYSDEQKAEIAEMIAKAKQDASVLEQWTIMEDTLRRLLRALVAQQIAAGICHPFAKEVAETMYSVAIKGRNFDQEKPDEAPDKE